MSARRRALQSCTQRLGKNLTAGDWERVQAEIATRDHLLQELAQELRRWRQTEPGKRENDELQRVKQVLEEVRQTSQTFIAELKSRCSEYSQRIKGIQQGRAAMNLYRAPKSQAAPRFIDRKG